MRVAEKLNSELCGQDFAETESFNLLKEYKRIAESYSITEDSIAVLSDMGSNKSWIYYGGFAEVLGIESEEQNIDSIWEKHILEKLHPDDLDKKHISELLFFHFMKQQGKNAPYYLAQKLRMKNNNGEYISILHRIFYAGSSKGDSLRLALCLYNPISFPIDSNCLVINKKNGEVFSLEQFSDSKILSKREAEVLKLIHKGHSSQDIADLLFISKNTVSRHRQEILSKLQVKNSIEACRIAKALGVL